MRPTEGDAPERRGDGPSSLDLRLAPPDTDRRLQRYREKRSASSTGEPWGGAGVGGGWRFVVQKHRASSLHWDLRLEMHGVLVSWAIPKGPSPSQADKRLAVHVEDHPLEYADFEGVIPDGSYGAGPSIVWDRGRWTPVEDPDEGMRSGKLLFDLHGYKLRGRWTLVRTKGGAENHWLLIKERDGYEDPDSGTDSYPDDSILSGLTVEELGAGGDFGARLRGMCEDAGGALAEVRPEEVTVMTATARDEPFSRTGWLFEVKYDGYRLLGAAGRGAARLFSRGGNELTRTFPEVAVAVAGLPYRSLVLDGEVVVNDSGGLPSFGLVQRRGQLRREADVARAAVALPATYYAFDLLACEGYDLRGVPLLARKELLREALPTTGPVRYSEHVADEGVAVYRRVVEMGLEGVVAKRADSPYLPGRSPAWLKVCRVRTADFAVHGYTEPEGDRPGFGALHLASWHDGAYRYAGRVGTGFDMEALEELGARLREAAGSAEAPMGAEAAGSGRHRWVVPEFVAEVRYKEVTASGALRQPSLLRIRTDKAPEECSPVEAEGPLPEPEPLAEAPPDRVVHFTNLDKVLWPDAGYTKGDLVEYYRAIAPVLLPYLADRPLVLTRYPDGIDGKSFFQKNFPDFAPAWIRRVRLYGEGSEEGVQYCVADDLESLLYVANSASIPLHIWQSRAATVELPDFCVLDLDPKGAPFADVVTIALFLRELCDLIGLPSFVKTSGSTGVHVLVPLGGQASFDQSRSIGHLLALVATGKLGDIATVARRPSQREGKVYIDYVQNGPGRLIAAPYCVRPLPGAPVSTPLEWEELEAAPELGDHTIWTVPARVGEAGDPMLELLTARPDLPRALTRLEELIRS